MARSVTSTTATSATTTVFKLTSRYDFSDAIAIAAQVSTGFRAPTLAREFYQGINVSSNYVNGIFAPNSAAAGGLGFGNLKPEKSTNYSLGLVLHPASRLAITIDVLPLVIILLIAIHFYSLRIPHVNNQESEELDFDMTLISEPADNKSRWLF